MALLADTHVLVWLATGDSRLTVPMTAAVIDRAEPVLVSLVTAWEFADLSARRRLPTAMALEALLAMFDLTVAALPSAIWRSTAAMPMLHGDPIDRMLIAHALAEGHGIITADAVVHRYPVRCIG